MSRIREIADLVWHYRLEHNVFLRLRRGLPITHIRAESPTDQQADAAFATAMLDRLDSAEAADGAGITEEDVLTMGFLRWLLGSWLDAARLHWLNFTVTPYSSYQLSLYVQQVFSPFQFDGTEDPARYLSLVADYRNLVGEMATNLATQQTMGILLPRPALPATVESLRRHRDAARLLLPVAAERLTGLDPATTTRFTDRLHILIEDELTAAFDQLLASFTDDYTSAAPEQVGCAQYPDGAEYYQSLVALHTTSERSAEEIHQIGMEQVAELAEKMAKARADLGFTGTEVDFHAQLAGNPRFYATDPEQLEATYRRHIAALEPRIGQIFATLPKAPYGLARLPSELEAGMTYGYYQPPTSAEPVGRYMFNGSALDKRSMLTAASVIFHELAPGHHFHMARQAENTALPDVRREAVDIGAFNEGWAEYAADLGWDLDLYADPYDGYGRLVHERFTAQRLVVDTGLGALGWTLGQAQDYMRANTTESDTQIATETLRYATDLPGQALAYRLGYLEFTGLRDRAAAALGPAFDLREFHELLLAPGALPFPVIRDHLDRWLALQADNHG